MRTQSKASILVFMALLLAGCVVSGPKDDGRTIAEKLNGESYQTSKEVGVNQVLAVPLLERKAITRKFSGHVYCGELAAMSPANHASVSLSRDGQELVSVFTDASGGYEFSAQIDPQKSYELSAGGVCGHAKKQLTADQKRGAAGLHLNLK